ncbi:MAG: glycosyltransferase family 2 protein [Bacteroidota bacterium]
MSFAATLGTLLSTLGAVLSTLAFAACALVVVYLLVFALASRRLRPTPPLREPTQRLAVFIPAYKEDAVIVDVARQALDQSYPQELYEVIVIADSLQPATLAALDALPIQVVEVSFEKSTKAKALNAALSLLAAQKQTFDGAVVLDADNVMDRDALAHLAAYLDPTQPGSARVVQGQRVAKNLDTPMAKLDALSEGINNQIFRAGHANLGLSAALIGSGMAFDYELFDRCMNRAKAVGGFDKELELMLLYEGIRIAWAPKAVIYDEKVSGGQTFENQRTRWLSAQFHYLRRHTARGVAGLFSGRLDYADKVFQMALPPRALLIAGVPALTLLVFVIGGPMAALPWAVLTATLVLTLFIAIPANLLRSDILSAVLHLPGGIWRMTRALFRSPGGNRTFIHTPHGAGSPVTGPVSPVRKDAASDTARDLRPST